MNYNIEKVRYISHEVKNQLSICDLYTEVVMRYCDKNSITDETIRRSIDCIKKAVAIAGNSLLELKSSNRQEIGTYSVKSLVEEGYELSKVYVSNKPIKFYTDVKIDTDVDIDKNRFLGVLINLVKNASEAFVEIDKDSYIKISVQKVDSVVSVIVSNNAPPTENLDLFSEGVTTKKSGSGLGLYISRKNMEEMGGSLKLLKSDNISTEFEIMVGEGKSYE